MLRLRAPHFLISCGLWLTACSPGPRFGELVLADQWSWVPTEDDPFADWREGAPEDCDPASAAVEYGLLELYTGLCDFITLSQPLQLDIRRGDMISHFVFHNELYSTDPATALVALSVEEEMIWRQAVAIPSPSNFYLEAREAGFRAREGDRVYLHVQNHGANQWAFVHFRLNEDQMP